MAGTFNMMALMNEASKAAAGKPKYEEAVLPIESIIPNPKNLYSMDGIDELADAILLAGRVLQNIVVAAADADGHHMIISGHRRVEACRKLAAAGHDEFGTIPALIENEADENLRELMLIYTNSTSRILTDAEKMHQAERATELLRNLKAEGKFTERIRDTVARMLNATSGQLARYAAISKNLTNPELREAFEDGRLGISAAYESSGLSEEGQKQIADKLQTGGAVSIKDVAEVKEQEKPAPLSRPPEVETTGEGLPISKHDLTISKKYKARATVLTVEKDGKFYAASDGNYKSGGWGSYPSTEHDQPYDTEQEAIEAEIKEIALYSEEWHRILWESGYHIVGNPAAREEKQEEAAEPPAEKREEETEPPVSPQVYAWNTVINELTALEESYSGAAERNKAMGAADMVAENLRATAGYFKKLISYMKEELAEWEAAEEKDGGNHEQ